MKKELLSEYRKLFTVRSTYVLSALAIILIIAASFVGSGFVTKSYDQYFLTNNALNAAGGISFFVAFIAVLLLAHEYRYKTIDYSLALSNSRSKALFAKVIVILAYSMIFSILATLLSIGLAILGAHLAGHIIPPQSFDLAQSLGKSVYYCTGFALAAMLITAFIRNLAASVGALLLLPSMVENLLALLLKSKSVYLPFKALESVVAAPTEISAGHISPLRGAIIFGIYLVIGWLIAWRVFIHRDAS
jgi:ABC-type transport system involved in multi-copper enzyme maturation permease subunit